MTRVDTGDFFLHFLRTLPGKILSLTGCVTHVWVDRSQAALPSHVRTWVPGHEAEVEVSDRAAEHALIVAPLAARRAAHVLSHHELRAHVRRQVRDLGLVEPTCQVNRTVLCYKSEQR